MKTTLRPPAVPLVTVDPYFNIWSRSNTLHGSETTHWTGKHQGMVGMAKIDGKVWRFLGGKDRRSDYPSIDSPPMDQTGLSVHALSTIYTFEAGGVRLTVDFTTPLLPEDLEVLSRPASYVTIGAQSIDGNPHQLEIYYDITGEVCVDVPIQEVTASRGVLSDGSTYLRIGTTAQPVLRRSGDDLRIDWGYAYLAVPQAAGAKTAVCSAAARDRYAETGAFPEEDDIRFPRDLVDEMPLLACTVDFGTVDAEEISRYLVLAYDDIYSIEYFGRKLPGYWRRKGMTAEQMLGLAIDEHAELTGRCQTFNGQLLAQAEASGGAHYADILALAFRQAIAAHKLVADENGEVLFLSKENFSNGCIGTVDVSYPSIPMFLLYNPELAKGLLRPIFRYAGSGDWPYDFAPHDVGRYPLANGQAYGMPIERQMPIEECGNMLIMTAAVCLAEGKADFASRHWDLLTRWFQYLTEYGMDPGNQLCTDDFGGHLAHNANLSIKAIVGIASYGLLCALRGDEGDKEKHIAEARRMASEWEKMSAEDDHYRLAFDSPGTWSLKYNLVWDRLFELNIFPEEVRRKEVQWYLRQQNRYGIPLDNRQTYTKTDWLVWAAVLGEDRKIFETFIDPLWDFLNESSSRVPLTDWYYTMDGRLTGFINRSVVGGLFIKLLADRGLKDKARPG